MTLGIIGIVAAMTLPTLINNSRNKQLESSLKVAYSIISQGLDRMNAARGDVVKPADFQDKVQNGLFYDEFKTYFTILHDCEKNNPDPALCMSRANNYGGDFNSDQTYKTYNDKTLHSNSFDDGQFVLPNGMLVMIENPQGSILYPIFISVDINGKRKKPNKLGHDLFTFQLMNNGKLVPMGADGTIYPEDAYCSSTSSHNLNGIGCTYKALTEKDYFKNLPR